MPVCLVRSLDEPNLFGSGHKISTAIQNFVIHRCGMSKTGAASLSPCEIACPTDLIEKGSTSENSKLGEHSLKLRHCQHLNKVGLPQQPPQVDQSKQAKDSRNPIMGISEWNPAIHLLQSTDGNSNCEQKAGYLLDSVSMLVAGLFLKQLSLVTSLLYDCLNHKYIFHTYARHISLCTSDKVISLCRYAVGDNDTEYRLVYACWLSWRCRQDSKQKDTCSAKIWESWHAWELTLNCIPGTALMAI